MKRWIMALLLCSVCASARAQTAPAGASGASAGSDDSQGAEPAESHQDAEGQESAVDPATPGAERSQAGSAPEEGAEAVALEEAEGIERGDAESGVSDEAGEPAATTAQKNQTADHSAQRARSAPDAPRPSLPVRVVSRGERPVLLYRRAEGSWQEACGPPCEIRAPRDLQDYALSSTVPGAGIRSAGTLWVAPGDGIEARLRDRRRVRLAGAGLAAAALGTLLVDLLAGFGERRISFPIIGGAFATGVVLSFLPDKASVRRCIGCNAGH